MSLPAEVSLQNEMGENVSLDRETFYQWLWQEFGEDGLLGVHEGTLLSEEAAEQGLETESWTVDAGEAPRERDWVGKQAEVTTELFFASAEQAKSAVEILSEISGITVGDVEEQEPRDWDAEWKASFLNAGAGVEIPPFWRVVPPWVDAQPGWIKINPGAGFGTGTHEATQLCLQSIGQVALDRSHSEQSQFISSALRGSDALDFGSGSGILAIGLAKLGAKVKAVEIDPLAIDNAIENASLNLVQDSISFSQEVPAEPVAYDVVVANILRPVLIQCADVLTSKLAAGGTLILSGLIHQDVQPILETYRPLLPGTIPSVLERGEWRAVVFKKPL